jgi:hypothetical protein
LIRSIIFSSYESTPRCGVAEGTAVLDRWLAPDHRCFKVRTADRIYILRNVVTPGEWEATLVEKISNEQKR